jgi:PAS domain S-box-containing protein
VIVCFWHSSDDAPRRMGRARMVGDCCERRAMTLDEKVAEVDRGESADLVQTAQAPMAGSHTDVTERRQAEEALRESESNMRSLLENARNSAVYRIAVDPSNPYLARVLVVSPSMHDLFGVPDLQDFASWFDAIHPDDLPRIVEANRRSFEMGVPFDQQLRFFNNERGEWTWAQVTSTPVFDAEGKLTHFNGLVVDITEQKRAEQTLQRRLAFEELVASISTEFVNLGPDEVDAGIQHALRLVGEFDGADRSYVFLLSGDGTAMTNTHEWCAEGIESYIDRVQDVSVGTFPWIMERLRRLEVVRIPRVADLPPEAGAEREEFQVQAIQSLLCVPMAYRGSLIGFVGFDAVRAERVWTEDSVALLRMAGEIFVNALEHKRAQQALRESEEKFRGIVEYANVGIAIVQDARFQFVNPHYAHMLGYTTEEMLHTEFMGYCAPEERERIVDFHTRRMQGEDVPTRYETAIVHKDDSRVYVDVSVGFIQYGGRPATFIFVRDITKQRQAQDALQVAYQTLERRIEERTRELAAINAVSAVVSRSLDLKEIASNALDKTLEVMGMDLGVAYRLGGNVDEPPGHLALHIMAYRGISAELARSVDPLPLQGSFVEKAAAAGRPVVWSVADYPAQPRKQALEREGVHLGVSVPLLAKGELVGAIVLGAGGARSFAAEELSLLAAIGQQVGMAVENARLYKQAEQAAALAERSRLARELHDSATQSLYSVTMFAEAAARLLATGDTSTAADYLRELRDTAQEALREMRLLIFELRPQALERSGLAAAIQARLEAVEERGGVKTELRVEGVEGLPFPVQQELYHVAREALNNALKHARAQRVWVRLCFEAGSTSLEIQDDGAGFEPSAARTRGGMGLPGMEERAQRLGGRLEIESAPGKGTRVILQVPMDPSSSNSKR